MRKFFIILIAMVFAVSCTDDIIRADQTDFFFRPSTEQEAITAGCSNPETALTMIAFRDLNNNGLMDSEAEESTAVVRQTLCGGSDGQDGQDGAGLVADVVANDGCFTVTLYLDIDRSLTVSPADVEITSFPVCNGADGQDGADGVNGSNGADAPFLLVESVRISPLEQELTFYQDIDGSFSLTEGDTVVERIVVKDGEKGEQGIQGIQGPQGERGADGEDGMDGTNGTNGTDGLDGVSPPTLAVLIEKIEGTTFITFYYDLNENGELDNTDVIASTATVTDGADGLDGATGATGDTGAPGADGQNGENGYNWLFTSAEVVADPYCSPEPEQYVPYTGADDATRVTFIKWIDTGDGIFAKWRIRNGADYAVSNVTVGIGNGSQVWSSPVLQANTEVFVLTSSSYNGVSIKWDGGSKGTASSGSKPSEAEMACEGGLFLFGGLDTNRDGELNEGEITLSQLIPAGADGADGVNGQDFTGTVIEYIDPLPGVPAALGNHKELLMKVTYEDETVRFFGVYYDHSKKRTFLSELFPGVTYATTDGRKGTFNVENL